MFKVKKDSFMLFLSALLIVTLPAQLRADQTQDHAFVIDLLAKQFEELAEVKVSLATRTPKPIRVAPAMITVVTAEQIRKMGGRTLLDVVRRLAGVSVSINNIGNHVIHVRGVHSYHGKKMLMMINNHRVNELHSGGTAWSFSDITLDNIKQIELIRGPGSALYGENAFAGIINIITKRYYPTNKITNNNEQQQSINFVSLRHGTQETNSGSMLLGSSGEDWSISAFIRLFKSDGFAGVVEQDVLSPAAHSYAPGKTDDWQEQQDIDLLLSWQDFTLQTRYLQKRRGPFINITDALSTGSKRELDHFFISLKWDKKPADIINVQSRLFFVHHKFDNHWVGYPPGFKGEPGFKIDGLIGRPAGTFHTYGVEVVSTRNVAAHNLMIGASWRKHYQFDIRYWANFDPTKAVPTPLAGGLQEVSSWANWSSRPDHNEDDFSFFGQNDWQINNHLALITGIRYDNYDQFGGVVSPRIGLTWEKEKRTVFKLLYGQAFRAPTYAERFTINNPALHGNPDLNPETVDTIEASVNKQWLNLNLDLALYYSQYRDLIVLGKKPTATAAAPYINQDEATAKGVELTIRKELSNTLALLANYTWQSFEDDVTGATLPGIARHRGNIELQWEINSKTFLNSHLYWSDKRSRELGDSRPSLAGYGLVNLALLRQDISKKGLDLQISINNLLDKNYHDPAPEGTIPNDFPRPGIDAMMELRYRF